MILFPIPSDNTSFKMVVKTLPSFEELCAEELRNLGAENVEPFKRAVSFEGNKEVMYRVNLESRLGLRVLIRFAEFEAEDENELYDLVRHIRWEDVMDVQDTLAIDTVLNTEVFRHSQYISQKTKDAICDRFRDLTGKRPSVDLERPDIRMHIHVTNQRCSIFLDSSGDSLHKRGYRDQTNLAPLNEVLAAGLVQLSGWDRKSTFVDPMCGSGTILIEAAMLASGKAAGSFRDFFGFMRWKKILPFDQNLWTKIKEEAEKKVSDELPPIHGVEISPNVIRKAKNNLYSSGLNRLVSLEQGDFLKTKAPAISGEHPVLLMNPPYGERMAKDNINELYGFIGDTFKKEYAGYECWIISSNFEALKKVGLSPSKKIVVYNGALECRFVRFSIYQGSKREPKAKEEQDK